MKTKFSKHMIEDRMERYATIATKVGFGEVIFSTIREPDGRVAERRLLQMTSTGVCIVRSMEDVVITMFCATISITKCYFPNQELSPALVRTIRFNERKGYCNIQVAVVRSSGADYYIIFQKTIDFFIIMWYNIYVNKREPIYSHK